MIKQLIFITFIILLAILSWWWGSIRKYENLDY